MRRLLGRIEGLRWLPLLVGLVAGTFALASWSPALPGRVVFLLALALLPWGAFWAGRNAPRFVVVLLGPGLVIGAGVVGVVRAWLELSNQAPQETRMREVGLWIFAVGLGLYIGYNFMVYRVVRKLYARDSMG